MPVAAETGCFGFFCCLQELGVNMKAWRNGTIRFIGAYRQHTAVQVIHRLSTTYTHTGWQKATA